MTRNKIYHISRKYKKYNYEDEKKLGKGGMVDGQNNKLAT